VRVKAGEEVMRVRHDMAKVVRQFIRVDGDRRRGIAVAARSSAGSGNGDNGRVHARGSQAKPRKRQRGRAEKWRCSGGGDLARSGS
jgi:hypothetical protein